MRLAFGPGEDDAFCTVRDALLDELSGWLDRPAAERAAVVNDVKIFLGWRYHHSSGVLDEFGPGDVTEFLLEWCPRRYAGHPDGAAYLCGAVGVYVDFMAATGRLVGGVERADRLKRLAADLAPTVRAEMCNPTPPVEDAFEPGDEDLSSEPPELPFVYVPPPPADVESSAAAAPLLAKFEALRDYLGPDGRQLTDKGNLKLADGRALVDLLDTGDEMDTQIGDKTLRTHSTANLPWLNLLLDLAKQAGAVRVHQRRLVRVKAWAGRSAVQRAAALFAAIVQRGPLETLYSGRIWFLDEVHEVLDDGIVHWLAPLLADASTQITFESVVEWAQSVIARQVAPYVPESRDQLDDWTQRSMSDIFEILEQAGVVRWTGRSELPHAYGRSEWTGGAVSLTALGRRLLPDYLDDAGYALRRVDDIADGDGRALIEALLAVPDTQHSALVAAWRGDRPEGERVQLLAEAIAASPDAAGRMTGFVALDYFDLTVAEPWVRQLLDTPVAGHAALWLISHERADAATLGSFVDVAVLVDMLAGNVDDPDELCSVFAGMSEPSQLLESMWRHPAPETAQVLDVLGRHLSDRALAKEARKAAVRHRSWLANRG